jgi:hypothetical protein
MSERTLLIWNHVLTISSGDDNGLDIAAVMGFSKMVEQALEDCRVNA